MKKILLLIYCLSFNLWTMELKQIEKTTGYFDLPAEILLYIIKFIIIEESLEIAIINLKSFQCNQQIRNLLNNNSNCIINLLVKKFENLSDAIYIAAILGNSGAIDWLNQCSLNNFNLLENNFLTIFYKTDLKKIDFVAIKRLLNLNKCLIYSKDSIDGNNALMISINNNLQYIIEYLITFLTNNFDVNDRGKIINQLNNQNLNALNLAAQNAKDHKCVDKIYKLLIDFAKTQICEDAKLEFFTNKTGGISPIYDVNDNSMITGVRFVSLLLNHGGKYSRF